MSKEATRLQVACPCCGAVLAVEKETGIVISSKGRKSKYSLDQALEQEKQRKSKADELFARAFQNEERRHSSLEEKFRKALDMKDELDDPKRPLDFD